MCYIIYMETYKVYKTRFSDRIELNLAEISSSPEDEFQLVKVFYDPHGFTCELCGHKHCNYAFTIKNLKTSVQITIGSECINHFKGKGIDIDLAEGLMKRVFKATVEARNNLRDELGKKAWDQLPEEEKAKIKSWKKSEKIEELGKIAMKGLSKEEKAQKTVEAYMVVQTIELLRDVSQNKYILSQEEIERICNMGYEKELKESQSKAEKIKELNDFLNIRTEAFSYLASLNNAPYDPQIKHDYVEKAKFYSKESMMNELFDNHDNKSKLYGSYAWLLNHKSSDRVFEDLRNYLLRNKFLSDNQVKLAKNIIQRELGNKDEEFDSAINWLITNKPNDFVNSVNQFYINKGYVTENQKDAIMRYYGKVKDKE